MTVPEVKQIHQWPDALEAALLDEGPCAGIFVLNETDSTQGAAARLAVPDGGLTTTWHQFAGRGRRGNVWVDTADEGVAMTLTFRCPPQPHLSCVVALGVIDAIAEATGLRAAAKWPNDVLLDGRKVAGILAEVRPGTDLLDVGIGVNVLQEEWEGDLSRSAISLLQAGVRCDRLDVITAVARHVHEAMTMEPATLTGRWQSVDALIGREVTIQSSGERVTGLVVTTDPLRGLQLETPEGMEWFSAPKTSIISW